MFEYLALGKIDLALADGESTDAGAPALLDPGGLLTQPKPLAVFTYLVLAEPQGLHRRDEIVAMFWPESDQKRSRAALSQALYVIRRALGPDVLEARGNEEIGIASGMVRCDALEFMRAAEEERLEDAMSLYGGELLPAFFTSDAPGFERWLDRQRAELAQLAGSAAWRLADRAESAGNAAAAGHWGRRAAALSPYDESSVQRLMEMLARLGDRSGALRAYERFRAASEAELEIEPSKATRTLAERIRASLEGPAREPGEIEPTATSPAPAMRPTDEVEQIPVSVFPSRSRSVTRNAAVAGLVLLGAVFLFGRLSGGPAAAGGETKLAADAVSGPVIAVLPLRAVGDADQERADVMTSKLAESLTRAGFRMPPLPILRDFGDALPDDYLRASGARWIVEGDLSGSDDVSELSIHIVDPESGTVRMARPFREGGRSTMDFMLEVAQQTADTLAALMGIEAGTLRVPRLTTDPIADSLYAQVRFELPQNYTLPGLRRGAEQLEQAIARDSEFAPAYVLLADVLYEMSRDHWDPPPREQMARVQALLDRALELDPTSPDVHRLLGWVAYTWDWDWAKAEEEYREALRLGPNNTMAHGAYAFLLLATGRIDEGLEESRRSVQLDPMNPITGTTYCWHLYLVHRFDDALAECRYVTDEINPTKLVAVGAQRLILAFGATPERRPEEARRIHITDMDTRVNYEHSAAIWAAMGGDTARALALIDADKRDPHVRPFRIANAYAWAGQLDSAFVWLDRAIEARDPFIPEIAIRPVMEPYREDPRYFEVLQRVGLPVVDLPQAVPAGEPTGVAVTAGL